MSWLADSTRCRRSPSSLRLRGATGSSISAWLLLLCSLVLARPSAIGAPPVSMPGWDSRTAIRSARPIRPGQCLAPDRYWSRRGRTSPTASQRGPPDPTHASARYAWTDHYGPLRAGLKAIALRLRAAGERAVAFADDNSIVDREVAYLGGLGWFGKNANVLLPGAGSWFVLGSVITTATYPAATPVGDGCGACTRCIERCPTAAIVAPGVIDANRCLAWVLQRPEPIPVELREAVGDRIYGCDDCQEACPPTVRFGGRYRRPLDGEGQAWVDVLDLLETSDDDVLDRYGRWYIAGRDPRWLRRNALVVLGNTGDARDRRTSRRARPVPGPRRRDARRARHLGERASRSRGRGGRPAEVCGGAVKHLLVTNDFPPKIGGIQSLLWEWWRRLPPDSFAVMTSPHAGAVEFDAAQAFRVERVREPVLLPHPPMVRRINDLAAEIGADLVVLDPAVPLGLVGPSLKLPYDVVLHGAEVTVPGRLPGTKQALAAVLPALDTSSRLVTTRPRKPNGPPAGRCRSPSCRPASTSNAFARSSERAAPGPQPLRAARDAELVVSISRLVPRKGFDVVIRAVAALGAGRPDLVLAIAGGGRDERRLRRIAAETKAPVQFLGRVSNEELPRLYACGDVYTMACRRAGEDSSRRGSASCSSRPRRAVCRRSPGTPVGPQKPWSTA